MIKKSSSLLLCLLMALQVSVVFAQNAKPVPASVLQYVASGKEFYAAEPFAAKTTRDREVLSAVDQPQLLTLDQEALAVLMAAQPQAIALTLPYNGTWVTVDLLKADVTSPDFTVVTSESAGRAVAVPLGLHYRGMVRGDERSLAAFSFFATEVMGMISDDTHGDRVLGKLDRPGNTLDYVLYADSKLKKQNPFSCGVIDQKTHDDDRQQSQNPASGEVNGCVRVYIEADNELYINRGSSTTNTTNYLTAMFNQVATLYTNETISTVISQIYVWTTADSYSNTSSSTALNQFRTTRTTFTGDIAHLASLGGQGLGGVAYLDVLCGTNRYAYSNINSSYSTVPTYSWTIEVFTHEMGHNLGSNHTQWCGWTGGALDNCYTTEGGCVAGPAPTNGGTIMSYCHLTSYGINFNNGFGTQPGNKIRTRVSAATCLAASCGGGGGTSCGTPSGLSATSITNTTATVGWSAVSGATSYNLQWKPASSSTWTTVSGITTTNRSLTGLTASSTYNFQVQANCNGTLSSYSAAVNFTTTGGATCPDAYEANNTRTTAKSIPVNTNITAQIASSTDADWYKFGNTSSTRNIKIDLTTLPADYDLQLYRNSTLLATSQNSGTANEQIIYNTTTVSTGYYVRVYGYNGAFSNTQCYTLRASLSGTSWLQNSAEERNEGGKVIDIPVEVELAGFGMFPNPANETLTLDIPVQADNPSVLVSIFDVAGKLRMQEQPTLPAGESQFTLPMGVLSDGVYFVQVRNGDEQYTRKLVVQH